MQLNLQNKISELVQITKFFCAKLKRDEHELVHLVSRPIPTVFDNQ